MVCQEDQNTGKSEESTLTVVLTLFSTQTEMTVWLLPFLVQLTPAKSKLY